MRAELEEIEADAADPLTNQTGVLSRRQPAIDTPSTSKQELARTPPCDPQMLVDGLSRLLREFEPHRPTGLLLPNSCPVSGVAMRSHVVDADGHHVAAAQLAIDGEIKKSEVTGAPLQLKPRPN